MDALASAKTIVLKIGSALLVDQESGELRLEWLRGLAQDIQAHKAQGIDIIIVSSGSIALGRRVLDLPNGDLSLEQSQAAAAVGQIRLARAYEEVLAPHDIKTAQVLLTLEDSADRRRYLNSRATLSSLLGFGVVPIVNENDTVATDEIRFGDNDRLAAQVCAMAGANILILLSDVDGLYTGNPKLDEYAQHIDFVDDITTDIEAMAGDAMSSSSKGGMRTKIMAAKTAMAAGAAMAIVEGDVLRPLETLKNGARATWFKSKTSPAQARKQWISGLKPKGTLFVDAGAGRALISGKSLLSAGLTGVEGTFARGDLVVILDPARQELGRGLSNYDASEIDKISGRKSSEIERILGYPGRAAVIHRDNMVMR